MIRFVVIWNVVLTVVLVVLLVSNRHDRLAKSPVPADVPQADVLRARRVELVDREGHLTAVLGEGPDDFFPRVGLTLLDPHGRQAVTLGLNDRGYGNLYFQSSQLYGKVSVGYFSGSDQVAPLSEVDPGGMWGIRVLKPIQRRRKYSVFWIAGGQYPHRRRRMHPLLRHFFAILQEMGVGAQWLFVDVNSNFASVEQEARAELRGEPVAFGGRDA